MHCKPENDNAPKRMSKREKLKVIKLTKVCCPKCGKKVKNVKQGKKQCSKCGTKLTYPCSKCDQIYSQFNEFRHHVILNHLDDELKKSLQCSACSKNFTLYQDLEIHQYNCIKLPDLQCTLCPFRTEYRRSLAEHLKMNHGMGKTAAVNIRKQFICAQCGNGYTSISGLRTHRKYYCGKPSLPFADSKPIKRMRY